MKPTTITAEEAESLLPAGKDIHTFRNASFGLIGCDWSREKLILALHQAGEDGIQLAGEMAARMKHGLVINHDGALFIETVPEELAKIEEKYAAKEEASYGGGIKVEETKP